MTALHDGTTVEQVGAYFMQDDPLTSGLAEFTQTQAKRLVAALD
jgi:hypothetical protein